MTLQNKPGKYTISDDHFGCPCAIAAIFMLYYLLSPVCKFRVLASHVVLMIQLYWNPKTILQYLALQISLIFVQSVKLSCSLMLRKRWTLLDDLEVCTPMLYQVCHEQFDSTRFVKFCKNTMSLLARYNH